MKTAQLNEKVSKKDMKRVVIHSMLVMSLITFSSCSTMTSYEYSQEANAKIARGELSSALESYAGAISKAPPEDVAYYVKKRAALQEQINPKEALKEYDSLIANTKAQSDKMIYLMLRGELKTRLKDNTGALSDFTMALDMSEKVTPTYDQKLQYAKTLIARAKVYQSLDKSMEEMADYAAAALLIKPDNTSENIGKHARERLADALSRFDRKNTESEKALHPEAYQAYENGVHMFREKDYFGAIGVLSDAIKANSNFAPYYNYHALSAISIKDYKLGLSDADKALQLSPYRSDYLYTRSIAKDWLGEYNGALEDINKSIMLSVMNSDYSTYQEHRENVLERIEKRDHPDAYALYLSGIQKQTDKNYAGAIADYTAAIKLNPKYPDYYWRRAISESWNEGNGYIDRWMNDCSTAYNLDNRARYWITRAEGAIAKANSYEYLSLDMAYTYGDARYAYKNAAELDPANAEDLMAKSRDAEYRSKDTENRVRYPSYYNAQSSATSAPTTTTFNLLRDKSRSSFLHDYIVIFECPSTKDKRRYEVSANDQSEAANLARDDMHRSQWCSYNESFVSAQQAQ
ncbi:MAG: hypothetical protein PHW18_07320 [Sulfuricurvum sp.]|uniref:hypothetical protein n=1 Tax=Sulfuricurvum sp. TaxID=2025608 RepID=UPI002639BCFF|nr:hypothetical protein [Sulfuricurvum sp.]MDD2829365.1 hypothetical protein [Sulfuricurvum sp.]MDD4949143.1 hypothetical protein [Sulfuricurvum sp.]